MKSTQSKTVLSSGVGRRKSSTAFVQLVPGKGEIIINNQPGSQYFRSCSQALARVQTPLKIFEAEKSYNIIIIISGGGRSGQIQAIQLALANAISKFDSLKRAKLRSLGFLSRDTRVKERKKYGLKKARKAPQYSKR